MRKLFLLLLIFFSSIIFAQEVDTRNRFMFSEISKMSVSNSAQRDLLTKTLDSIQSSTSDLDLKDMISKHVNELSNLKFTDTKSIDLNSLTKSDKRGWYFKRDKFKGITFITKRSLATNKTRLYIGVKDTGDMYLRFKNNYIGSYWVFADKITFLIDGEKLSYEPLASGTDVSTSANVTEYFDTPVNENLLNILQKIANSKEQVEFQFSGKSTASSKITENQKQGIKETLEFYERLKAK